MFYFYSVYNNSYFFFFIMTNAIFNLIYRKSTQVPQFILEDCIMNGLGAQTFILVAQPRRIAAISLAERVNFECGAELHPSETLAASSNKLSDVDGCSYSVSGGDNIVSSDGIFDVGHEVRLESSYTNNSKIVFCTTGVLLRKLQSSSFLSSKKQFSL